jgi:hypothetical protein
MKITIKTEQGTVLVIALLTITVMTLICATSLYITSQNANAGMQTASWQQALTGAESGVDSAIRALNAYQQGSGTAWTNWKTVISTTLPTSESSIGTSTPALADPTSNQYNYLPSSALSLSMQGEGATSVSSWVTVDTAGMQPTNKGQWYRIRSTGVANAPAIARVSANKLDDNLRNTLGLRFNRKTGVAITGSGNNVSQVTRTVEVVTQPVATSSSTLGIVSRKTFIMGGNGFIDSFDSGNSLKSTNGQYDINKRQSNGDVGILDSSGGSTLNNGDYIYGSLTYSGPAVQHTQNVQGTIATPFNATVPPVNAPNWASGSYSTVLPSSQGNTTTIQGDPTAIPPTGTASNPLRYKVSSIVLSGHQSIVIQSPTDPVTHQPLPGYDNVQIWVTGDLGVSGNAGITQDSNANVTYYVEGNISLAGNSIVNQSGLAADLIIDGVTPADGSTRTAYIAGNGNFIGLVDAPSFNTTYAGNGDVMGAIIANTLTLQGNGSLHYDQALNSLLPYLGPTTYAFASWFEDNSDPTHKDQNGNYVVY